MTELQINTSSLTSKILKLAKRLNRFTVEDIQRLAESDESDILLSLKELEKNFCIEKFSQTEYLFVDKKVKEPKHRNTMDYMDKTASGEWLTVEDVCKITGETPEEVKQKCKKAIYQNTYENDGRFKVFYIKAESLGNIASKLNDDVLGINLLKQDIDKLLSDVEYYQKLQITDILKSKADCDFYNSCSSDMKKTLIKHLVLFKLVGNIPYSPTKDALTIIAEKHPFYNMCAHWYKKKYNRFKENGLASLYYNQLNTIDPNIYEEFKKIYFSDNDCSQKKAYRILSEKIGKENLPTLFVFSHRLRKEYKRQAIKNIKKLSTFQSKNSNSDLPELTDNIEPKNITFKKALQNYMNSVNITSESNKRSFNVYCTRLIDFFEKYKIGDIDEKQILKFREKLITIGTSLMSVKAILGHLFKILSENGINLSKYKIYNDIQYVKPLSLKQIYKIVNTHSPEAWIIGLGLKITEIAALEYEDIDFKNRIAVISKLRYQERKRKFYSRKIGRWLKIPSLLLSKLDPNGKGPIFKEVNIKNYEQLVYAHIMLMNLNNVPMNIIAKNMGHTLYVFYSLYSKAFLQELDKDFDLFKGVFNGK